MDKKKKTARRIIIAVIATVLAFFLVVMPVISLLMYNMVFGIRYETYAPMALSIDNFPGLKADRYEVISNEGQKLAAYNYYRDGQEVKGIVVMAHGIGGGGHNSYMGFADYFTKNGYYAFAYDATGNDESEGNSVKGLPQGVIDLDHVISFVENDEKFKGLPILLFGHSWGGYSATSVLNEHPEVTAVCSIAGFNKSTDLLQAQGEMMAGGAIYLMLPYLKLYERIKFGDYSTQTAMDGFRNSDAKVMIAHSENDDTVPIIYGYDIYYDEYADDKDFVFIRYKDKGHNGILDSDARKTYMNEINKLYSERFGKSKPSDDEKAAFYNEVLDKDLMATFINKELMEQVVDFYDRAIAEKS